MKAVLSAALVLLLAACSESTGAAGNLHVQTDKSVYSLPGGPGIPAVPVQFTVKNTGSFSVVLPNCGAGVLPGLQRRQGATWVDVGYQACPAFAVYAPLVLAPGETASGQTNIAEAGVYRIRVAAAEEEGGEFSSYSVSPIFEARWLKD
jgi:hypothetical protein